MSTDQNIQQPIVESASISYTDPATLLVDRNVRTDIRLDRDFVASVRELGVLVPIVAVRTTSGELRVRYGHRRTAAAVEAGHAHVPVVVAADEATDEAAEIERLVGQYAENEHRTGLTTGERVDVFTQLSAFGVSAAQIAKRTKTSRKDVAAALAVSGSELARAAASRHGFLTLEQAAVVAEFDGQASAVKALVVSARDGGFDHVAQQLRDERAEQAAYDRCAAGLVANGVQVLDQPLSSDVGTVLRHLIDEDGERLDDDRHRSCPGHAAYIVVTWQSETNDDLDAGPVYFCTDPQAYGHQTRWWGATSPSTEPDLSDEDREAIRAERRQVVANNKAWRSAQVVRREWLASYSMRKTAPIGAARLVADLLLRAERPLIKALEQQSPLAKELVGTSLPVDDNTPDRRAQHIGLVVVLAAYEADTGTHSWRNPDPATARYLRFIAAQGYELSAVEGLACGDEAR